MRRLWMGLAMAIAFASITGGAIVVTQGGGTAATAALFVNTTAGSCTRSASPVSYETAAANGWLCGSLASAYASATTGDTILIKDGTYVGEQLAGTKTLTFRAAGPGRPSFGQLIVSASNLTVEGIEVENRDRPNWTICNYWDYTLFLCGDANTWRNVIVDGLSKGKPAGEDNRLGGIQLTGNNHTLTRVEVKDVYDNKGFQGGGDGLVVEDSYFHDVKLTAQGAAVDVHLECAAVTEGNNQVWRRNRFWHCGQINWVAQNYNGGPAFGPVILENNVFAHPILGSGNDGWQDGAPCLTIVSGNSGANQVNGWIIRFNTFECDASLGTASTADDNGTASWYGNLGVDPGCSTTDEWVVSYNVGSVCASGTGNVVVANALNTAASPTQAPFYTDEANNDFTLASGANSAVNVGSPAGTPSVDLLGLTRPFGASADAGAYERQN